MHYRNGRPASNGDKVVFLGYNGSKIISAGVLYDAVSGNGFCNGQIAPLPPHNACLCDCLHIDDIAEMIKEKGLDKRPAGK